MRISKRLEKTAKNIYNIDFDNLPSNFNNLTDKELKNKQDNLNNIKNSSDAQKNYNPGIEKIDSTVDEMLNKIRKIREQHKKPKQKTQKKHKNTKR